MFSDNRLKMKLGAGDRSGNERGERQRRTLSTVFDNDGKKVTLEQAGISKLKELGIDPSSPEGQYFLQTIVVADNRDLGGNMSKYREEDFTIEDSETSLNNILNNALRKTDLWKQEEIRRNNATYGEGMTLQSIQDLYANRKQQGIEFQKSAADIARDIINGTRPTVATTQARQIADSGVSSLTGFTNAQPTVDAALMNRNAQNAVQQQQRQAIMNTALARATEIGEARKTAANAGLNIQGTGLTDYSNFLRTRGQLQQAAATDKAQAEAANKRNAAAEEAAGMQTVATAATIAAMAMSDRRAKENIRFVGIAPNGLNMYIYRYKPELLDHPLAMAGDVIGYMADEVEAKYPESVFQAGEYKAVDYTKIPTRSH